MKLKAYLTFLTIVPLFILTDQVEGAVWAAGKEKGKLILNVSWYDTSSAFDLNGSEHSISNGGRFTKLELNPYVEYGLTDEITVVGNFFLEKLNYSDSFNNFNYSGSGDQELGLRFTVFSYEPVLLAVQGNVKFPLYRKGGQLQPGNYQTDLEGRILAGSSFMVISKPSFWNLEVGFRHRNGYPADELRTDATLGTSLALRWLVLAQVFSIKGLRNGQNYATSNNPSINPNYDLHKGQISVVFGISDRIRLQGGYFFHFAGVNTGAGNGFIVSLWIDFGK